MKNKHAVFWVLTFLLMAWQNGYALWVEVEGTAVITDAGIGKARQTAINDAIRQAAVQAGAHIQSKSEISNSVLVVDNVKVRATGKVRDVKIIDEWKDQEEELYTVRIRADVVEDIDAQLHKKDMQYRRKIAVLQFDVLDRRQIHDVPNIEVAMAKEFARRLANNQLFLTKDASQYSLVESSEPYRALGLSMREIVVTLANNLGVQFIITGTIMDMGTTKHPLFIRLRHVELEIKVWDGIAGTLVSQRRLNSSAWDNRIFDFPTTIPTMNDKYYASPIGKETNHIMAQLVDEIGNDIKALPFMARVMRATGKSVYLDVGSISDIQVGDVLMSYKLAEDPEFAVAGGEFLGYPEQPATVIVVKKVQPNFSIGELESESPKLNPGDVVRVAW